MLLSSDTPELVHLCDRVAVVREGRIVLMLEQASQRGGHRFGCCRRRHQRTCGMSGICSPPARGRRSTGRSRCGAMAILRPVRRRSGLCRLWLPVSWSFLRSGFAKFTQSWFPLALVAMAQAILMLTGGISLSIGAMVSLGAVISATAMAGPLGVAGGAARWRLRVLPSALHRPHSRQAAPAGHRRHACWVVHHRWSRTADPAPARWRRPELAL